jgi:hypothetical protein
MHHSLPACITACITCSQHSHRGTSSWTDKQSAHASSRGRLYRYPLTASTNIQARRSLGQTVCKEEEEGRTWKQPRPPVMLITHCQHNHRITLSQTDSVQRRGGRAHVKVAEAACIAHGLLDHMHGLIHGFAPLLLALRGHICSTTRGKGETRLGMVTHKANCPTGQSMTQPHQNCHCIFTNIYTSISFQPCRLKLESMLEHKT